jgi:uncharacterized protein YbjT (DUF2867 family)
VLQEKDASRMKISRRIVFAVLGMLTLVLSPLIGVTQDNRSGSRLILVSGATGTQGGAVARALIERGFAVRGLTRNPDSERARALSALGAEMVRGDFEDTASLDAALAGTYGAYSVQQYRGIGVEAEIRQSKAFADAAKRAGVRHFVYSSVLFAHLGTRVPQFDSKVDIEEYIQSIGLPYSFVRPASFMSNFEGVRESAQAGVYRTPFPPNMARLHIAPGDIGRVVAEAFANPETWIGRDLNLAGQRISYADIAATMERVLGREVRYEQIPWEEYSSTATPMAVSREQWFMANPVPIDLDGLHREFPGFMTIEEYLISAGWGR